MLEVTAKLEKYYLLVVKLEERLKEARIRLQEEEDKFHFKTFGYAGRITDREAEVVKLVRQGLRNKEIANIIGTTERTVKAHVSHVLRKMKLDSRRQL